MKFIISALAFLFIFAPATKAQGHLDVRNFNNTYEITIIKGTTAHTQREAAKCQAVRLNKDWFLTAAHCFKPICDYGCAVQARLIVNAAYEMDIQTQQYSASDDAFKLHEREKVNTNTVGYDIALLHFDPAKSQYIYKDLETGYRITQEEFLHKVRFNMREYNDAISGVNFPTILKLKAETPKLLNRSLAVASIWDGSVEVLASYGPVFFMPKGPYLYTDNFGIRKGISGSGVMTSSGELVGVVSSTGGAQFTLDGEAAGGLLNLTFLSVLDDYSINFILRNAGNVRTKDGGADYLKVIPQEQRSVVFAVEKAIN